MWVVFKHVQHPHTTGTGLMIINNITQIAEAIEGHKDDSIGSLFVIMIGTFNALGRLMGGGLSDYLIGRVSRPSLLALALLGMAAGSLIFAFATYELLYIAVPVCATAYGMYWAIGPYVYFNALSIVNSLLQLQQHSQGNSERTLWYEKLWNSL